MLQIDPVGIAAVLSLTGPVAISAWPEPITAANVSRIAQNEVYLQKTTEPERDEFGQQLLDAVLEAFKSRPFNLTDAQKNNVHQILDARKATFESLHQQARANWDALQTVSESSSPDPAAVGAAFLKLKASRHALQTERESVMQQIRPILTTDQKNQLDTMKQEHQQRLQERMGTDGPPGR